MSTTIQQTAANILGEVKAVEEATNLKKAAGQAIAAELASALEVLQPIDFNSPDLARLLPSSRADLRLTAKWQARRPPADFVKAEIVYSPEYPGKLVVRLEGPQGMPTTDGCSEFFFSSLLAHSSPEAVDELKTCFTQLHAAVKARAEHLRAVAKDLTK